MVYKVKSLSEIYHDCIYSLWHLVYNLSLLSSLRYIQVSIPNLCDDMRTYGKNKIKAC